MTFRQPFETLLTYTGLAIVPHMPRRMVVGLSRFFGTCAYYVSGHLRRVGLANLDIAYGNSKMSKEKQRILKQSFRTFALTILDLFWFSRKSAERIERYVHFEAGYDDLRRPEPFLCVTAHMGNWELIGQAVNLKYVPLASIAATLANPTVDVLFNRIRSQTGQVVVPKQGAVRKVLQTLKNNGTIAVLLDQNTKPSEGGIFVDFFGLPAPVSAMAATLHIRTGAELRFGGCIPEPDGSYRALELVPIHLPDVSDLDRDAMTLAITKAVLKASEDHVRQHPEHWLWMYKRWKYIAPGRYRSDYPFYAKEMQPVDMKAAGGTA